MKLAAPPAALSDRTVLQDCLAFVDKCSAKLQGKNLRSNCRQEVANVAALAPRAPKIVVDAGANKGDWTVAAKSRWPEARFILFEPAATHRAILSERHPECQLVASALSNKIGEMTLYADFDGSGIASLHQRNLTHHGLRHDAIETVSVTTLDAFCAGAGIDQIDVLKLDIEGHELAALQGAVGILPRTGLIQFEFGGTNIDSRTYLHDFWLMLTDLGFSLYRMTPFGPTLIRRYSEREECFLTTNFVARATAVN